MMLPVSISILLYPDSIPEFGSIIWNPSQESLVNQLNKIQRHFSCSVAFTLYKSIGDVSRNLGLESLKPRRFYNNVTLFYKLVNAERYTRVLDCSELLSQIQLEFLK